MEIFIWIYDTFDNYFVVAKVLVNIFKIIFEIVRLLLACINGLKYMYMQIITFSAD